ncbi:MAG: type II toxin-antitoxin system CcdA family antitoxin [Hyphomicrobiaceae bacterium]
MQDRASRSRKKKSVNLSIDAELAAEAKAAGTNMSAVLERALREEMKARRETAWREENRGAIEASNAELERNGLWCDKYRVW